MSMAPHWLDKLLEKGTDGFASKFTSSSEFKRAIAKAQAAFADGEHTKKKHPDATGNDPAQAARVAFLAVINDEEEFE